MTFVATVAAEPDTFDSAAYVERLAAHLQLAPSAIELRIAAGSVTVTATIRLPSIADTARVATSLNALAGDLDAATDALGVEVESAQPPIQTVVTLPAPSPPPPGPPFTIAVEVRDGGDGGDLAFKLGFGAMGIALLLLAAGLALAYKRMRRLRIKIQDLTLQPVAHKSGPGERDVIDTRIQLDIHEKSSAGACDVRPGSETPTAGEALSAGAQARGSPGRSAHEAQSSWLAHAESAATRPCRV